MPDEILLGLKQWFSSLHAKGTDVQMNKYSEKIVDLIAIRKETVDVEKNEQPERSERIYVELFPNIE